MVDTFNCDDLKNNSLKQGSKGEKVTLLQTHLKTLGYYTKYNGHNLKIDGIFGQYTAWALKNFQKATGNKQDADFGPVTCKTLNEKILAKNGVKTTTAGGSSTKATTTKNTTTTAAAAKPDPYKIDTSKNIYKQSETNFHIQGINLISSSITINNAFRGGNWKQIELSDGTYYTYQGNEQPRAYTVITYIAVEDYNKLKNELYKLQYQPCNVSGYGIEAGQYSATINIELTKKTHIKLTFNLNEFK